MPESAKKTAFDTLVLGHITRDLLDDGSYKLGGTVSYAGLTSLALGASVAILSSFEKGLDLSPLNGLDVHCIPSETTTTYRNISTDAGRVQYMHNPAARLNKDNVEKTLISAAIVHFGPVADEIEPQSGELFGGAFLGLTPQGWLRGFDNDGRVHPISWHYDEDLLHRADATVLSSEDLGHDPVKIDYWRSVSKLLVLTKNVDGGTVFSEGKAIDYGTPKVPLVEDTGAGDIFAACFFHACRQTADPLRSAGFAAQLAAASVTRRGFDSIPTPAEVYEAAKKFNIKAGLNG